MNENDLKEIQEIILAFLKWGPISLCAIGFIASVVGAIIDPYSGCFVGIAIFGVPLVLAIFLYPIYFK